LQPLEIEGLQKLRVYVPDRYDLVLMKAMRCRQHDLEHIEQIHLNYPLDPDVLVARFKTMITLGPAERSRGSLLAVIGRLFGDVTAERVERSLD
jgi:hypothetical protein